MAELSNPLKQLQLALAKGNAVEAAAIAFHLATEKTDCIITEKSPDEQQLVELTIIVERNGKQIEAVNVAVRPTDTLLQLKTKMHDENGYHPSCQQWIINNKLIKLDGSTLSSCGVTPSKRADVFLTILEKKIPVAAAAATPGPSKSSIVATDLTSQNGAKQALEQFLSAAKRKAPKVSQDVTVEARAGWVCGNCTYVNKPGRPGCEICSAARPEKGPTRVTVPKKVAATRVHGWECGNCTFLNQPTRPGCEVCADPPPDGYRVPDEYLLTPAELERIRKEQECDRALKEAERNRIERSRAEAIDRYNGYLRLDEVNLIRNEEPFECPICMERIEPNLGVNLRDCLHSYCEKCLREVVNKSEQTPVGCPVDGCPSFLLDREIMELVPEDTFQQYLQRGVNAAEVSMKDSFHCLTPDCRGWCVYEDDVNTFECPVCETANCLTCRIIHAPRSCKEYQDDLKLRAKTEVDARQTLEQVENMIVNNEAIRCPGCGVVIMKTSGCPHIKCTYCKLDSNWPNLKNT